MQGFVCNSADVSIGTAFALDKKVKLSAATNKESRAKALPNSCYLSHCDIQLTSTGSITKVDAFISWDSGGDSPVTGLAEGNTVWQGLTGADIDDAAISGSVYSTAIPLNVYITAPDAQTASGEVYLHIRTTGGNAVVKRAKLHWATLRTI